MNRGQAPPPPQAQQQQAQQQHQRPGQDRALPEYQRRPTDRNLPERVVEVIPDAKLYQDLQDAERRLDATLSRKRLDLADTLTRNIKKTKTLRVFISNTAVDQPWQNNQQLDATSSFDFDTGVIPSYVLKIEGRLLDGLAADDPKRPRFSSFFTSIIIELETPEDDVMQTDGNIIEWHEPQQPGANVEFDVLDVKRKGDQNVKAKIQLQLKEYPDKLKLSPELAKLLAIEEETKPGVVIALWQYIKFHKLQDSDEKRTIKCDQQMKDVFGTDSITFPQIMEQVSKHLFKRDPIEIEYEIRVDVENTMGQAVYDIEVEMDDPVREEMVHSLDHWYDNQNEIMEIDEQIALTVEALNNSRLKRDFFQSMADDPQEFMNKWVASQARDLRLISSTRGFNEEEVRKSEFYDDNVVAQNIHYFLAQNRK